jgi:hypothetical protein
MKLFYTISISFLVLAGLLFTSQNNVFAKDFREGYKFIKTPNSTNKNLRYYYYLPEAVVNNPGTSHNVMVLVPGYNQTDKEIVAPEFKIFAEKAKMIIVSPNFVATEEELQNRISYHYPAIWSGNALLGILSKFNSSGIKTSKLFMLGASAGAQYVLRFSLWKPDIVKVCISHAPGSISIPDKKINVRFFYTIGQNDEQFRLKAQQDFITTAQKLGISVKSKVYPNLGHTFGLEQVKDFIDFFQANLI